MYWHSRILGLLVFLAVSSAFAQQNVRGLSIDYPHQFTPNREAASSQRRALPSSIQGYIRSLEVFKTSPLKGLREVNLAKIQYTPQVRPSIDGAVDQALENLSKLSGMQGFTKSVHRVTVSDREARRASFEADRANWRIAGEFLFLLDRRTNTLWQFQVLFGREKSLLPKLVGVNLSTERALAVQIIDSVRVSE